MCFYEKIPKGQLQTIKRTHFGRSTIMPFIFKAMMVNANKHMDCGEGLWRNLKGQTQHHTTLQLTCST